MRRVSSKIPRSHVLRSLTVLGEFAFYGVTDSLEIVTGVDVYPFKNRLEMLSKLFGSHSSELRRSVAKEREKTKKKMAKKEQGSK